ncbi:MAG: hypothetical protein HQ526_06220 [Actinobacteria bacterium]|nr:hypothetical protein [Actinomycetota bacterium]
MFPRLDGAVRRQTSGCRRDVSQALYRVILVALLSERWLLFRGWGMFKSSWLAVRFSENGDRIVGVGNLNDC